MKNLKPNVNLDYFNDKKQIPNYNSYVKLAKKHVSKLHKCLKSIVFCSRKKLSSFWLVCIRVVEGGDKTYLDFFAFLDIFKYAHHDYVPNFCFLNFFLAKRLVYKKI